MMQLLMVTLPLEMAPERLTSMATTAILWALIVPIQQCGRKGPYL